MAVEHARLHGYYAQAIKLLLQEEGNLTKDAEVQIIEVPSLYMQ